MQRRFRFTLWLLPFLGFIFGIVYVFMFVHGLTATWSLIGNPSIKISEILGDDGQTNLFVKTTSGDIYSFNYRPYFNGHNSSFADRFLSTAPTVMWKKENIKTFTPEVPRQPTFEFITWPVLFKVKQTYENAYPLVEGETLIKFSLSEDGNLWIWSYGVGELAGIMYFFYPPIGLLLGLLLIPIIKHWNVYPARP